MRSSRSSLFAPARIALVSGLLMLGAGSVLATSAQACPEGGGACPCGAACPSEHAAAGAADCGKDAAGGCAGEEEKAACACPPGEDGNCACGAECGSKHGGSCAHNGDKGAAGAGEKKAGSCGCGGAGAATEPGKADEKAAPCGGAGNEGAGGAQRAVIDPVTGQLTVPDKGDAAAAAEAAPAQAQASANAATGSAQQLAVPGAGVMAPFPNNRASHAVAKVDDSGEAHMGCEHAAE